MKSAFVVALMCAIGAMLETSAGAQKASQVAGNWEVRIRMPDRTETEHWTIEQKGRTVSGRAKGQRGDMPVSGSFDGVLLRVTVKDGESLYKVRATLDGDDLDGSITIGVGKEYLWQATRAKPK